MHKISTWHWHGHQCHKLTISPNNKLPCIIIYHLRALQDSSLCKVSGPNSVHLEWDIYIWMCVWLGVDLRMDTINILLRIKDWTTRSIFVNKFWLNNEYQGGGDDYFIRKRIFTLTMKNQIQLSFEITRRMATWHQFGFANYPALCIHMFHILGKWVQS